MERKHNIVVLVTSDMSGKPIASGVSKTFSGDCRVKIKNLSDEVVTDYSGLNTGLVLKSLRKNLASVFAEYGERDSVEWYLICGGACLNACLVVNWFVPDIPNLKLLVWEKKVGHYIIYDLEGRMIENDCDRKSQYTEREEVNY